VSDPGIPLDIGAPIFDVIADVESQKHPRTKRPSRARGFTLIEASLASVIIGVGFLGMLQLLAAGTMTNLEGAETTTAVNLTKNIREMTLTQTYSQVSALNRTYSPPIDSRGQTLNEFSNWQQTVSVQPVDPNRLTLDVSVPTQAPCGSQ